MQRHVRHGYSRSPEAELCGSQLTCVIAMLQKDEFTDPSRHPNNGEHLQDWLAAGPCQPGHCLQWRPESTSSTVYRPTQCLATSCNRRLKYDFLSCAVMLAIILTLVTTCILSSSMPLSSSSNASRFKVNLDILVTESCDPAFISAIDWHINQAVQKCTSFVRETDVPADLEPLQVSYSVNPVCDSRRVLSALDHIFGNSSINAVISLSTYDMHGCMLPLTELYHKAYLAVNTHIPKLGRTQSISFWPSFSQCSLMLATVLELYQWQDLYIIHSSRSLWQDFAIYLYLELTVLTFRVHLSQALISPVASTDACLELGRAKHFTVVLLLMDVPDQLLLLQTASVMSMTQRHAFFTFATSPYDKSRDSVIGLQPSLTQDPRFISDSRAKGVNIFESLFVLHVLFSAETARANSAATGHTLTRRAGRPTPGAAGVTRMASDSTSSNVAADSQTDLTLIPKPVVGFKTRSDNSAYLMGTYSRQQTGNRTISTEVNSQHDSHTHRTRHHDLARYGSVFRLPRASRGHVTHLNDPAWQLLFARKVSNLSLRHPRAVHIHSTHHSRTKPDTNTDLPSEAELRAIYDTVFLVTYGSYLYSRRYNVVPFGHDLISSLTSLTFPGSSGDYRVDEEQKISYDFAVYDFNATSAALEPRLVFQALSSESWRLRERRDVSWPGGVILPPDPCFKQSHHCDAGVRAFVVAAAVISVLVVLACFPLAGLVIRRHWLTKEMTKGPNKVIICSQELVFVRRPEMSKSSRMFKSRITLTDRDKAPDLPLVSEPTSSMVSFIEPIDTQTAVYNGDLVHVKELGIQAFEMKRNLLTFIRMCKDLRHENLTPYIGFLADGARPAIVMDFCSRGSVYDIVNSQDFKLDWEFKLSLLVDLVKGLRYLHSSPLKFHGHVTSKNCMIDSRFVLKITDYGVSGLIEKCQAVRVFETKDLLWTAPELLRDAALLQRGSEKGDIYSMAIIFQEMVLRMKPYGTSGLTDEEIVKKLKKPPPLIRPSVTPQAAPPLFIQIMKQCWSEMPDMRPSIHQVYDQFKALMAHRKTNIVDTMFKLLEKYSTDLEDIVAERTAQLAEEKKKTDQLLCRMLPPTVAESLKMGRPVEAECFDQVTIYFSDIVGFTTISAMSSPMQVVDLLNDLYTMFDATINDYEVYKVETIGDAYMVVSGLPVRNGNRHAGEIATLALVLLSRCGRFSIRHMPRVPLRLRIGLHTGSCVAGVVGLIMPRFCLFGDTVNTASRMESTGAAFRIHISEACKQALDVLGGYVVEYRGQTELKGKGMQNTYWLLGKEGFDLVLPAPPPLLSDNAHGLASILGDINLDLLASMDPSRMEASDKSSFSPDVTSTTASANDTSNETVSPAPKTTSCRPRVVDNTGSGSCSQDTDGNKSVITAHLNLGEHRADQ